MKPIPAIVQPAIDIEAIAKHLYVEVAGERDDIRIAERHEEQAANARASAKARRLRIGALLAKVRGAWPERGPKAKGWGEYLKRFGISEDSALRYIAEVRGDFPQKSNLREIDTPDPIGDRPRQGDAPPLALVPDPPSIALTEEQLLEALDRLNPDARGRIQRSLRSKQGRENEGNRDAYCTPSAITALLPEVDLDPCSNPRSTVRARRTYSLEAGQDGLALPWSGLIYANVPYSAPLPWAEKHDHERGELTGAGFLVNADHSPAWWRLLRKHLTIRLDFDERIEFDPPPGVESSKNDRPQTLLMDEPFWAACNQRGLLELGALWRLNT